jgi:hypothetical protein
MSQGASANAHAIIDGSNLATEGRSEPSLAQLDEAVRAIDAEFDFDQITVIVDATFEHRVAKSETKAARAAIDDGDIITPPAGVIGRGDAFILEVADRADAVVFSNDSFQEFHGTYDWLFDEGRLVGGKPIPGVGWIYVARSPVRGPVSRRATAESRRAEKATKKAAKAARKSTKKAATRGRGSAKDDKGSNDKGSNDKGSRDKGSNDKGSRDKGSSRSRRQSSASASEGRNDPALWTTFRNDFPVGSTIAARVERFSSHGAYGSVDDVVVYLPNRLLGDPPPTKARDVLEVGSTMDFVVHRYDDERKGIDAGLIPVDGADDDDRNNRRTKESNMAKKAAKKSTKKKAPAKKTAAKKTTAKKTAKKAPAKKTTAKKTTAKKTTAKKTTAKKTAKKAPAKKTTAKKTAKKAPAKKTAAKKTAAKKTTAKKTAKKAPAKKTAAKKATRKTTKRR